MSLKQQIVDDMKSAMRDKQAARLENIRLLRAAIQRKEVDDRTELDDQAVVAVVQKLIKQSQDAMEQFTRGGRDDLVQKEQACIDAIKGYLPAALSESELSGLIDEAFRETSAETMKDMGRLMAWLKPKIQGRADMGALSAQIKERLT